MGQQQLLLLILGIVIISAAAIYGIQAFDENRLKSREDAEVAKIMDLASQAQAWKAKPAVMGGSQHADPADYSDFTIDVLGLTPTGGPSGSPYVEMPGAGCFRFFRYTTSLRINALNEDCVLGSWTKGVDIRGPDPEDITWSYRQDL